MDDEYDFSEDFNKSGDNAPLPPRPNDRELNKNLPASDSKNNLRSMLSMPLAGGTLTPAKIGNTYGARWTANFSKGGKVSSASKRGDGIAQRGKTKGRML
jgi:hypothetical protein